MAQEPAGPQPFPESDFSIEVTGAPPDVVAAEPPVETAPEPTEPRASEPGDDAAGVGNAPGAASTRTPARNADGTFRAGTTAPAPAPDTRPSNREARQAPDARIAQLTYDAREAQREVARLREQLDQQRQPPAAPAAPAETPQAAWQRLKTLPGAPRSSDFSDYDDFILAATDFVAQHRQAELVSTWQRSQQHARAEYAEQQRFGSYAQKVDAVLQRDPQWLDRISPEVLALKPFSRLAPGERPGPLNALAEEIIDSPHTVALLQHFTAHPDDLQRFQTLRPRELTREVARLEARYDAAPAQGSASSAPAISQAHPPIQPVSGAPPMPSDAEGSDGEPVERFIERENAREQKHRAGRWR